MIRFECTTCKKGVKAHDKYAGQTVQCPNCQTSNILPPLTNTTVSTTTQEMELLSKRPVMFRNNPIGFIVCCFLCLFGIGFLIFIYWFLKNLNTTLIVTNKCTTLRTGILSKHINEVHHKDVRNIQIKQSFLQRLFRVGSIGISSAGQSDVEIIICGITNPQEVKDLINKNR